MRMFLLAVALSTSGCALSGLSGFEPSMLGGAKGSKVVVVLIKEPNLAGVEPPLVRRFIENDPQLGEAFSSCAKPPAPVQPAIAPALIPILASLGKLGFDQYLDSRQRKLDALKRASEASYSARVVLSTADLIEARCALLVRYQENEATPGLAALLHLKDVSVLPASGTVPRGIAFVLMPVYLRAHSSVAITRNATADSPEKIGVSIAVTVQGMGKHESGLPQILPTGLGLVTIPNVQLAKDAKPLFCDPQSQGQCQTSDLLLYPTGSVLASIAVAISEKGDTGIDFDTAASELKAIKEALGPALGQALTEQFAD